MKFDVFAQTDEQLCAASRTSEAALEALVGRYSRVVRACARPFFLIGGDSEDLVQEGMIGLLGAIRQYQPGDCSFHTYAAVCIKNRLISVVRTAAAQKNAPLNDSVSFHTDSFDLMPTETSGSDPEALYIGKESFTEFTDALECLLSCFEKQVLKLYLEGLSYSEIAQSIQKSAKSADNAVQRIRKKAVQLLIRR